MGTRVDLGGLGSKDLGSSLGALPLDDSASAAFLPVASAPDAYLVCLAGSLGNLCDQGTGYSGTEMGSSPKDRVKASLPGARGKKQKDLLLRSLN